MISAFIPHLEQGKEGGSHGRWPRSRKRSHWGDKPSSIQPCGRPPSGYPTLGPFGRRIHLALKRHCQLAPAGPPAWVWPGAPGRDREQRGSGMWPASAGGCRPLPFRAGERKRRLRFPSQLHFEIFLVGQGKKKKGQRVKSLQ